MKKKILIVIISMVQIIYTVSFNSIIVSAISCCKDGFDKSKYTLTGNMAEDVATIAKSQEGRTRYQFGYTEGWCDEFVADCIENAGGDSTIVVHGGTVADFEYKMKQKGAIIVNSPKVGDLVFFGDKHVEIITNVVNGIDCAGGNNGGNGGFCRGERSLSSVQSSFGTSVHYIRPNYKEREVPALIAPQVYTKSMYYVPNAEVEIKWDLVNGATGYWIDIWRDNEHILSQSLNNPNVSSYTYKCSKGNYGVFIAAYSENGGWTSVCSNCYNFFVRDISAPKPTTSFNCYIPNSNVVINWDKIEDATGYWLDIWNGSEHTLTQNIGNVTSYTIENIDLGNYNIYIAAFNENGGWSSAIGEVLKFYVKETPSKPEIVVNTDRNSVLITWDKCDNTDYYGIRIVDEETGQYYKYIEPYDGVLYKEKLPKGNYIANVASVQKNGFYTFSEEIPFEIDKSYIIGDCNSDEKLSIVDVLMLQKWILNDGTELIDWQAADIFEDDYIDIFDLVMMKRLLLSQNNS